MMVHGIISFLTVLQVRVFVGSWSKVGITLFLFVLGCGRKSVDAQALIVGGKKVKKGDYPWQAAIYDKTRNNMNICGGTIISMKTIVSGIHML